MVGLSIPDGGSAFLPLALTRRLRPGPDLSAVQQRLEEIRLRVNRLYTESLRKGLALAQAGCGGWEATSLIAEARQGSLLIEQDLERCEHMLCGCLNSPKRLFSPMRAAAANLVSFCVLGAASSGCHKAFEYTPALDAQTGDALAVDARPQDSSYKCDDAGIAFERLQLTEVVTQAVPCFAGDIFFQKGSRPAASITLRAGYGYRLQPCSTDSPPVQAMAASAQSAVWARSFPCLEQKDYYYVSVQGAAEKDATGMLNSLAGSCSPPSPTGIQIILDSGGKVQDVVNDPAYSWPVTAEVLDCVKKALQGLVFPCFAGMTVCPEYVIIE